MHAAILDLVEGEPRRLPIESDLEGSLPALEVESTRYLDGEEIYHGTAADLVEQTKQDVTVTPNGIESERIEDLEKVATDWYADFDAGWIGFESSDGEFISEILAARHGVEVYEGALDVDAFAEHIQEKEISGAWNTGRKKTLDDDGEASRVEINYHDSASLRAAAQGDNVQLGFRYTWGDKRMRGMVTRTGYVALYTSTPTPVFARWMREEIVPFLTTEMRLEMKEERQSNQSTLGQEDVEEADA
ncbi:MAG: hypothetical protein ACOCY1_06085 [Halovenus sp.]